MAMREHPFSVWALGGIPGGEQGTPSPTDLESWGKTWSGASYEYLIGVSARAYSQNSETVAMPAMIESQRRLTDAIAVFEKSARDSSQTLLNVQSRLLVAIQASSDCAATQTDEVIKLTRALKVYTIVLALIGVVQIGLMLWKR